MKLELIGDRWQVTSDKRPGISYHVFWSELILRWTCECLDWKYRRVCTGENCKHIDFMLEKLKEVVDKQPKKVK